MEDFLDFASKAKELGISEGALRARILSGKEPCFAFAADIRAAAKYGEWLPSWSEETFPIIEWTDHGSIFFSERFGASYGWPESGRSWYHINGWMLLNRYMVEAILTRGKCELNDASVDICNSDGEVVCTLDVNVSPAKEWVHSSDNYEHPDGGYFRSIPVTLSADDLFIPSSLLDSDKAMPTRKEQSYLGIIASMRGLLRHIDGGGFPSEAKIIEQLVLRFGAARGVSKRNLETVFADATRAADNLSEP